jgi:hypothetical protein
LPGIPFTDRRIKTMKWFKLWHGIWGTIILFVLFWTLKINPDPGRFGIYAIYIFRYQEVLDKYLYGPASMVSDFILYISQSYWGGTFGFFLGILIFGFLYGIIVGAIIRLILRLFKTPKVELKRDQVP